MTCLQPPCSLHSYFGMLYLFNILKLAAHRSCNGAEKMRKPKQMDLNVAYLFSVVKYYSQIRFELFWQYKIRQKAYSVRVICINNNYNSYGIILYT